MEGQGGEATKSNSMVTEYIEANKEVMQEEDALDQSEDMLALKLWCTTPNPPQEPSKKLDLFPSSSEESPNKSTVPNAYYCNYCRKKFDKPQALGGHQNAHKYQRRRDFAKMRSDLDFASLGYPPLFSPRYSGISPFGSYWGPLGVQMHSKIHKPSYLWSHVGSRYEHGDGIRSEMDYSGSNYFHANKRGSNELPRMMGLNSPLSTANDHGNNDSGTVSDQQLGSEVHAPSIDSTPATTSNSSGGDVPSPPMESVQVKEPKTEGEGRLDLSLKL